MPRHRFTLAALATLAVPGLHVAVTRTFTGGGDGRYDAALLTDTDGRHLVIRVPTSAEGAAALDTEARVLAALTPGVRARLPFAVPAVLGRTPAEHAVVTSYVDGARIVPLAVRADGPVPGSIARAVAAIHALPTSVVAGAGLPVASAAQTAVAVHELVQRADGTGDVPHELVRRWSDAAADTRLWRFRPVVVHGALAAEQVLTAPRGAPDEQVTGVLGWAGLHVGDPAHDLAWCLGLPGPGAAGAVLAEYAAARPNESDPALPQRALLHAELEIARWLLLGRDTGNAAVVADARGMLDALLTGVLSDSAGSLGSEAAPALTVAEVERLLDRRRAAPRSA